MSYFITAYNTRPLGQHHGHFAVAISIESNLCDINSGRAGLLTYQGALHLYWVTHASLPTSAAYCEAMRWRMDSSSLRISLTVIICSTGSLVRAKTGPSTGAKPSSWWAIELLLGGWERDVGHQGEWHDETKRATRRTNININNKVDQETKIHKRKSRRNETKWRIAERWKRTREKRWYKREKRDAREKEENGERKKKIRFT